MEKRKLLSEIQQNLKKVEEGVLLFDDIWDKVYAAEQQSLKEKYESDLKKEIKKLQRLRDQIKTWLGSSDVKDKAPLTEARKVIESKMEQFKICEKDTKTKAYSKEGLARAERSGDNKDSDREDKLEWVNQCLERLAELNENLEGEIEKASSGRGKTKNKDQIEKLENRMQKNKWHINKLEQVISLIEDGDLDPVKLDGIKENVDFYIDSAADDDGTLDVDDEFDIYEDLQIDAILSATDGDDDEEDSSPQSNGGGGAAAAGTEEAEPLAVKPSPKKPTPIASNLNSIAAIGKAQPNKQAAAATATANTTIPAVGKPSPAAAKPTTASSPTLAKTVPPAVSAAASSIPVSGTPVSLAASTAVGGTATARAIGQPNTANTNTNTSTTTLLSNSNKPVLTDKKTLSPTIIGQPAPSTRTAGEDAKKDDLTSFMSPSKTIDSVTTTSTSWAHAASTSQRPVSTPKGAAEDPTKGGTNPNLSPNPLINNGIASLGAGQNIPLPGVPPSSSSSSSSAAFSQVGVGASVQNRLPAVAPPQANVNSNLSGLPLSAAVGSRPGGQPSSSSSSSSLMGLGNGGVGGSGVSDGGGVGVGDLQGVGHLQGGIGIGIGVGSVGGGVGMGIGGGGGGGGGGLGNPLLQSTSHAAISPQIAAPNRAGSLPLNPELVAAVHMLKQSMIHVPEIFEGDKPSSYTPRNPFNTHPSFPSHPPSIIENPALFERLPMDTLFLAFYYQQGAYQQYLSAKQLKKHSWRFHKKYMTWFQRHEEPNVTRDEYEEGTYVYFDYESGWCQRIKKEFKFEYMYLEDEAGVSRES